MTISAIPQRIPPHNLDAEHAILGMVLMEGASLLPKVAAGLEADDFYTEQHRTIYQTMLTMGAAGLPIDAVTLTERLRQDSQLEFIGGPARLAVLIEQGSVSSYLSAYLDIVRTHGLRRRLIEESSRLIAEAFEAKTPALDLLEHLQRRIEEFAKRATPAYESVFPVRTLAELRAATFAEPDFHLHGWIPMRGLGFIVGDSGAYKSWFAKYLGLCIASGRLLFDKIAVTQGPVLYISEENGEIEDRRRADLLCRAFNFPDDIPFYIASETSFNFDDAARYAALRAFCAERRIRLIIVDSFVRVHRRSEKESGEMNELYMDRMKPLIKDGTDLILLHHKRKMPSGMNGAQLAQAGSDNDDIRGSGDIRASAHSVLFLKPISKTHVVVRHNKIRGARTQDPFVFSFTDVDAGPGIRMTWEGKPQDSLDKTEACKAAVLEYAGERPAGFFQSDVYAALKDQFSKRVIQPVLKLLSKDGYPLKEDEFKAGRTKKKIYTLVSSEPDADDAGNEDVPF